MVCRSASCCRSCFRSRRVTGRVAIAIRWPRCFCLSRRSSRAANEALTRTPRSTSSKTRRLPWSRSSTPRLAHTSCRSSQLYDSRSDLRNPPSGSAERRSSMGVGPRALRAERPSEGARFISEVARSCRSVEAAAGHPTPLARHATPWSHPACSFGHATRQ